MYAIQRIGIIKFQNCQRPSALLLSHYQIVRFIKYSAVTPCPNNEQTQRFVLIIHCCFSFLTARGRVFVARLTPEKVIGETLDGSGFYAQNTCLVSVL